MTTKKSLISFILVLYVAFAQCHRPRQQLLESIERLEKFQKAVEDETKILRIQASVVFGDSEDYADKVQHTSVNGGNYVRWGRTVCPETSLLIYKGYAGGSLHIHTGGAANHLCLPMDPQWSKKAMAEKKKSKSVAFVYGSEYQLNENAGFFGDNIDPILDDVPCAVCKTARTNVLMIPGRTTCYVGWKEEYTGYLMSGRPEHVAATEYVCVDENPEVLDGTPRNDNGNMLYLAVAKCGSLPCPPYQDGTLLSCVVCTM